MTLSILVALVLSLSAHADPAPTAEAPIVAEAPLRGPIAQRVRGEWVISLSEEEKRAIDLMAFVFSDPVPTPAMIAAKGLTPDETLMVEMLLSMRQGAPDDPQLAEMQRVLAELPKTTLTITDDAFTFGLAGQRSTGRYEIVGQSAETVTIRHYPPDAPAKEAVLSFDGDLLVMTDAGRGVRFRRK